MAEEKKKTTKKTNSKVTLDKNELSEIITNALLKYDKKKEDVAKNSITKDNVQDISKDKIKKLNIFKRLGLAFCVLANPSKYVKNADGTNVSALKLIITTIYSLLGFLFVIYGIITIIYLPLQFFIDSIEPMSILDNIWAGTFALMLLIYSRLLVVMKIEVEQSNDSNFIFGLFASVMAFVSLIIAITTQGA